MPEEVVLPELMSAHKVSKRYRQGVVLSDLSLQLGSGEILGVLGPNGSGKTTTLSILTGLVQPSSGWVEYMGVPVKKEESRNHFGFAPDDLPLPDSLTGGEYLQLHDRLRNRPGALNKALALAQVFALKEDLHRIIAGYSYGMRRKLQLIAAIMHDPQVLLLDEPYRGLDPPSAAILRDLLANFASLRGAVIIATHDMVRAERDCSRVVILSRGKEVAEGAPRELIKCHTESLGLEDVFFRTTGADLDVESRRREIKKLLSVESYSERTLFCMPLSTSREP